MFALAASVSMDIAFNEPPEPGEAISVEEFAALPTRVLSLSRETMTINSSDRGREIIRWCLDAP